MKTKKLLKTSRFANKIAELFKSKITHEKVIWSSLQVNQVYTKNTLGDRNLIQKYSQVVDLNVTPNFKDKMECKILCASRDQSHT